MSVMLKTTNPEAAGAMDPARDQRVPYVGQTVIYHARPGESRGGKSLAPAMVTRVEDDDHIEAMIIWAADDFITRWKIPRKTEQNPINAWSWTDWDEKHYRLNDEKPEEPKPEGRLTWGDVVQMHAEMTTLRNKVAALEQRNNNQQRK